MPKADTRAVEIRAEVLTWTNCRLTLGELKRWERNPAVIGKPEAARLLESLDDFGQVQELAIDPDNRLVDGHQRLDTWIAKFGPEFVVDCRRASRNLTEKEREKLAVYLRSATVGRYNWDELANWSADDLTSWGMDQSTLNAWNSDAAALSAFIESNKPSVPEAPEPEFDRAEELRQKWGVQSGDLFIIPSKSGKGEHRLICGDCTDRAVVERVLQNDKPTCLFTDPPYGVSIGAKNRFLNSFQRAAGRNLDNLESDDSNKDDLRNMLLLAFKLAKEVIADDCSVFVCAPQGLMMMMMMMDAGLEVRHVLNWVKNQPTFSLGRLDYDYQHEPILFTWKKTHKRINGGQFHTSVWNVDKPRANVDHPTMKPVELPHNAIANHTDVDDSVYEPFAGSGTTIVACEQLARQCRAIEISPAYVAVSLERLAAGGLEPRRAEL